MSRMLPLVLLFIVGIAASCVDSGTTPPGTVSMSPDQELFRQISETDPFSAYTLFPRVDSVVSGRLNGSTAHQPLVRVSLNAKAMSALSDNGDLPPGSTFPDGSIIFKQIITNGRASLYAIMRKDSASRYSANGWLWAEYETDGATVYSVTNMGKGCVSCHAREQGPARDHVRTFERRR